MVELNPYFVDVCAVIAFFSLASSGLVVYAHFKIPQLHKHPGQMIVAICIIQIIFDLHWIGALSNIRR